MTSFIQFGTAHVQQNEIVYATEQSIMDIPAVSLEREPTLKMSQSFLR